MSDFSAIVIGDESLAVQCGERLIEKGGSIRAVVTDNREIAAWAEGRGLRVEAQGRDLADRLGPISCDWLLSIANLKIIPDAVIAKATRGAVNFHDGPLPAYAGLNAPVWAILNGEESHGITWHLVEGGIDEGDILAKRSFPISPDETALTLNTKCYEAAIESFDDVIAQLASPEPAREVQDLSQRSYFGKDDRPRAGGRIDFFADAATSAALVRALDHAQYWNPLLLPKIEINGQLIAVGKARVVQAPSGELTPGKVLSVDESEITVAAGKEALAMSLFTDMAGKRRAAMSLVSVGDTLASLGKEDAEALSAELGALAPHDAFWRAQLADFQPVELPGSAGGDGPDHKISFAKQGTDGEILAAISVWASQFSGTSRADFGLGRAGLAAKTNGFACPWVPFRADTADENGKSRAFGTLATQAAEQLEKAEKKVGFLADLPLRDPALAQTQPEIIVSFAAETPQDAPVAINIGEDMSLTFRASDISADMAEILAARLESLLALASAGSITGTAIEHIPVMPEAEREKVLHGWNDTACDYEREACVHQLFERQVQATPEAAAVVFEAETLTYAELNARANKLAHVLAEMGVVRGGYVGLNTTRSLDLLIGALAIQKAGAAYVPLDPAYPADRVALYVEDSGATVIITQSALVADLPPHNAQVIEIDTDPRIAGAPDTNPESGVQPEDLAYLIFTSGSTGRPKGVMVEHRNVSNFFTGMDDRIAHNPPGVWLAVTSLSFDISVLELFYTLARGFKLILSSDENRALVSGGTIPITDRSMEFSLYYWGNDDGAGPKKYELLLEGAKFADENGFAAVWTPERHFHAFGGPYPNPSVTGAAVAGMTKNIGVRAGSCVAPLHHPARIAEEWAVIDNLTNGKAGLAIASGWQPDDFILRPENTPPNNKPAMFEAIETVRKLWRGEEVAFPTKDGGTHAVVTQPRPVSSEPDIWVTTAGNPATWKEAGAHGANVLTHLLGQSIDEVADKIKLYKAALAEAGYDPDSRTVTLMLHTYVGKDREEVREIAREPMKDYLRSAAGLIKQYAWAFPAFKRPEGVKNAFELDLGSLDETELEGILDFAFLRYFEDSGLFGTVPECVAKAEQLKRIGVDEIACLIDYGISVPKVLEGLPFLADVLNGANAAGELAEDDFSIAAQIIRHSVTHLQCTPSMARMLVMNEEAGFALGRIKTMMVGGEPLPGTLVQSIKEKTGAHLENMYGPTETTIWSSTETAEIEEGIVNIGTPIANTQLYVLDANKEPVPIGVAGELYIGGDGVTRGYWQREDLTQERFVPDPFAKSGGRMYRTGDLVRWRFDGKIEFIGRVDHQVKIRGYRIELGEIEAKLEAISGVTQAVVSAREDTPGDVRLVGYVKAGRTIALDEAKKELARDLPDFMVPSAIVMMDDFPLTPNKKVDRGALPAPSAASVAAAPAEDFVAPQNDVEAQVAEVWKRVLGVQAVGSKDNFFEIGGHSLLAVQAHREIKSALNASKLSITDIFRFPTLEGLAAHLGGGTNDAAGPQADPDKMRETEQRASARADAMSKRRAMRAQRRARQEG